MHFANDRYFIEVLSTKLLNKYVTSSFFSFTLAHNKFFIALQIFHLLHETVIDFKKSIKEFN